jgi:hypothetical protein
LGTSPSTIDINAGTIDGTVIGGTTAAAGSFTTVTASGEIAANGGIALGDNDKATFGTSDDLQIYHDGSNSWIHDGGTGNLNIEGRNIFIIGANNDTNLAGFIDGAEARLYYNGSQKLSTTATGINVTGTVTADGLTVDAGRISIDGGTDRTINITNGSGADRFTINNVVASGATSITQTISYLSFVMGAAEAMRIVSGNLLVGKTTSDLGVTAGIELNGQYDVGYFTRSGDKALVVNRLSSDGSITDFRKDGTSVGSIGTVGGDLLVGTGDTAFRFHDGDNRIYPVNVNNGVKVDGAVDLGDPTARFKDLYLSGGVVFGTTGGSVSSKTLDDYEEGTWTPAYTGTTGGAVTYGTQTGSYTKVGNLVTVIGELRAKRNTLSGNVEITGLPFTNSGNGAGLSVSFASAFTTDMPNLRGYTTSTKIALRKNATNIATGTPVADTDLADAATTENYLYFSATYLT